MNRIFRLVFNRALGQVQVASELVTRPHGGSDARPRYLPVRCLLAVSLALAAGGAWAQANPLPTGGVVVRGSADIRPVVDNVLTIVQNGRTVIDWTSFDIGLGRTVDFQQSTGSVALNRVTGGSMSQIAGTLSADAGVYLINPAGILFAEGATVNVGSLLASSLSLSGPNALDDFMAGGTQLQLVGSNASAPVVNRAVVNASAGPIALVAPDVVNIGTLSSNANVVLAGANSVTLSQESAGLAARLNAASAASTGTPVANTGLIRSSGGSVSLSGWAGQGLASTVVNVAGVIEATQGELRVQGQGAATAVGGTIAAGSADVSGSAGVSLDGSLTTSGALRVSAGQGITQGAGGLQVGGSGVFSAATDITLASASNSFGVLALDGRDATVGSAGNLALSNTLQVRNLDIDSAGGVTFAGGLIGGGLQVDSSGSITQTGALAVQGATRLDAGGQIVLTQAGNDFGGGVTLGGNGVYLTDVNDLTIDGLTLQPGGALSLLAGGALTLPATAIDTGGGALTLHSSRQLTTAGALSGGQVSLHGGDGVSLEHDVTGTSSVTLSSDLDIVQAAGTVLSTPRLSLAADSVTLAAANAVAALGTVDLADTFAFTNTQVIGQTADSTITVGGTTTLDAGGHAIALTNAGNDFGGAVSAAGQSIALRDRGELVIGSLDRGTNGSLSLVAAGDLVLPGADIDTGTGTLMLSSGGTLTTPGRLTGAAVDLYGATALRLDHAVTGTQSVRLGSQGGVTQAAAGVLTSPRLDLAAGSAALDTAPNAIAALGMVDAGGAMALRTTQTIGQIAGTRMMIGGAATFDAGAGNIIFNQAGNDFMGGVDVTGAAIALRDANDLQVTGLSSGAGAPVSLVAGGSLLLNTGAIDTGGGQLTLSALGGALELSQALSGGTVHLTGRDGIQLAGDLNASGPLTMSSTNAAITQTGGAISALGTTSVNAGAGAVTLTNMGNDFAGQVNATGGTVQLRDANTLLLGAVNASNLDVTASEIRLSQAIGTHGGQTYRGAVTLTDDIALSSGTGGIAFTSSVDGAHALDLTAASTVTFAGPVGASNRLASLTVDAGQVRVGGDIHTVGRQRYDARVLLEGDTALDSSAGGITFGDTVNGAHALTVTASGTVAFEAAVGDETALAALDAGATNIVVTDDVRTEGDQTYRDAVQLAGDVAMTSQAGGIAFESTLDGARELTVTAAGAVSFGGAVGGIVPLSALSVDAGTFSAAAGIEVTGDLSIEIDSGDLVGSGPVVVGGGTTLATHGGRIGLEHADNDFVGTVDIVGAGDVVIVDANSLRFGGVTAASLDATSQGNMEFVTTTLDGALTARSVDGLIRHAGAANIGGATSLTAGRSITFDHADNRLEGAVSLRGTNVRIADRAALRFASVDVESLHATAPELWLAASMASDGYQFYNGNVRLAQDARITSAVGDIDIVGTIDGAHALAVDAAGSVSFRRAVGGTAALAGLDIDAARFNVFGDITTVGDQTYRSAVSLGSDAGFTSTGGGIAFGSTVDGAYALRATAADAVAFGSRIGSADTRLASLTVDADRFMASSGLWVSGDVSVTAARDGIAQNGAWRVGGGSRFDAGDASITLTNTGNDFAGPVSLSGGAVGIVDANTLTLGEVQVRSLSATAATIALGRDIATDEDQTYIGAVRLDDDVALSSGGDIAFAGTIDGDHHLSATALDGEVTVGGAIGASRALSGLSVDARTFDGQGIRVTDTLDLRVSQGAIEQGGAYVVGGAATFETAGGAIRLQSAGNQFGGTVGLDGGAATIVNAGALRFAASDVASLDATAAGRVEFEGPVRTAGGLQVTGAGTITQDAALDVGGIAHFDAGVHAITLADAGNTFTGQVSARGGDVILAAADNLTLGSVLAGRLEVTAHAGDLRFAGATLVDGALDAQAAGSITQSAAIEASGTADFRADAGAIALDQADNRFRGAVHLDGGAVTIRNQPDLHLGTVDADSLDATAGTIVLGAGAVSTRGDQDYRGDVVLAQATGLASDSGGIGFAGTVTGAHRLAVDAGGHVDFAGAVAVGTLEVEAGSADFSATLDIAGDLVVSVQSGGIRQADAFTVGGTTRLDSNVGVIALTHAGNDFVGAVAIQGGDVSIRDANALTLADVDADSLAVTSNGDLVFGATGVAQALVADSGAGAISQTGALTVGGTTSFTSGNAITLADAGNDFGGVVSLSGAAVAIRDANDLTLADVDADSLTVTSNGDLVFGATDVAQTLVADSGAGSISQMGALSVGGTASFTSGAAITLTEAGNDFGGAVSLTGTAVSIRDANDLTLSAVDADSLDVTSNGDLQFGRTDVAQTLVADSGAGSISQTGALTVGGGASFASGDAVTLADAGNDFGGAVSLAGTAVSIRDANALTLDMVTADTLMVINDGDLVFGATDIAQTLVADSGAGSISQAGALSVGGAASFTSGDAITLADAGNDFGGAVTLAGNAVSIRDANALTLADVDAESLDVTSDGDLQFGRTDVAQTLVADSGTGVIGQTGVLSIGGAASFTSGDAITLADAGNDFGGEVSLAGSAVSIRDANALTLANVDADSLAVTSNGDLVFGATDVAQTLVADSGTGAISQAGVLTVGGTASFTSGNAIRLAAGNDFGGAVSLAGTSVSIRDANALTLADVDADSLDVTSDGDLQFGRTDVAQTLVADSGAGAINQTGALTVGGAASFSSGDAIALTHAGNDFGGAVSLAGTAVSIRDANALTLADVNADSLTVTGDGDLVFGATDVAQTLVADSGTGAISQTAALTVGGTASFTSGDAITLTDAGNDFGGAVSLAGTAVSIRDANALTLAYVDADSLAVTSNGELQFGRTDVARTLVADSGTGAIRQTAALTIGGTASFTSGAGITLTDAGNDFGDAVSLSGAAVAIRAANDLTLSAVDADSLDVISDGDLQFGRTDVARTLVADSGTGAISQTGVLTIGGAASFTSGDAITLTDAGNDFGEAVSLAGTAVSIRDANALALGTVRADSLEATSQGALGFGDVVVEDALLARSHGGAITQTELLHVGGTTTLDAGAGDIVLDHAGNDFAGNVDIAGGAVSLRDANDLTLSRLVSAADHDVSVVAGGALTLPVQAINAGTGTLHLAALGGGLQTRGALSGGEVSLDAAQGITLAHDIDAAGMLSLRSGGDLVQSGGRVAADVLDATIAGTARLDGANAIASIDRLSAQGIHLVNATSLSINGDVDAGDVLQLSVTGGDLAIDGRMEAGDIRLESSGGITQGTDGQLVARTLSGRAGGVVMLGDAGTFIDNRIERIGDFTARSGFSMTNGRGLTLASLNGSSFTIDAGTADFFLSVDGDLLQDGTDWLYNGRGTWAATGRIGQPASPIYVTGLDTQRVAAIGIGPAYFYALRPDGSLLPIEGESAVNVPTSVWAGRAQSSSNRQVAYVDVGADASNYRPYGVVETGIRLPPDQSPECDPDFPSDECVEAAQ